MLLLFLMNMNFRATMAAYNAESTHQFNHHAIEPPQYLPLHDFPVLTNAVYRT